MLQASKREKAIKAIHSLIIETRILTGNKSSHEKLFSFLDELEYLPALMLQHNKDTTEDFDLYLKEICEKNGLMFIYKAYSDS